MVSERNEFWMDTGMGSWTSYGLTEPPLNFPPAEVLCFSRFLCRMRHAYPSSSLIECNRDKNLTSAEVTKETFPIRAYSTQSCCSLALHWLVLSDRNQTWSYRITSMTTWLLFLQMVKSRPHGLLSSSTGWSPHMVWWWWWWLFSRSVMSGSTRPHGLQHARLPCPSVTDYPRRCLCLAASLLA